MLLILIVLMISAAGFGERPVSFEVAKSATLDYSVYFNAEAVRDKAKIILFHLEDAYQRQFVQQGFDCPLSYQVYLASTKEAGAFTAQDEKGIYTVLDPSLPDLLWPTYIHHEYQHACQFKMGGPSSSIFMDEASAVFQEILAFPEVEYWVEAKKDFQFYPHISLFNLPSGKTKYAYGGALFLLFLEEKYGKMDGHLIRKIWQIGEPWMQSIQEAVQISFEKLFLEFSLWRINQGDLKIQHLLKLKSEPISIPFQDMPSQQGCFFMRYTTKYSGFFSLEAKSKFPPSVQEKRALGLVVQIQNSRSIFNGYVEHFSGSTKKTIELLNGDELTLGICDLSANLTSENSSIHPIEIWLQQIQRKDSNRETTDL